MDNERLTKLTDLLLYSIADLYYRHYLVLAGADKNNQNPSSIHDTHVQALRFTKLRLEPYQELLGVGWDDFWTGFIRVWEAATESLIEMRPCANRALFLA